MIKDISVLEDILPVQLSDIEESSAGKSKGKMITVGKVITAVIFILLVIAIFTLLMYLEIIPPFW